MSNWNLKPIFTLSTICILLLALGVGPAAAAQAIHIHYIAPKATMVAEFGAANVTAGYASGYRGVVVTATNYNNFKNIASPNMLKTYDNMQPGQTLRKHVEKLLKISGGKVDVNYLLIDDRTKLAAGAGVFCRDPNTNISWPCASVSSAAGGRYTGWIRLGEEAAKLFSATAGGFLAWESVVLHETNHTQYVGQKTKWGNITITYGASGSHWVDEIIGGQALAFEEGIGNFFGKVRNNPAGINEVNKFFARTNHRYRLESWSVMAPYLYKISHKTVNLPPPRPAPTKGGKYVQRFYKWRDVPGYYLLFSESTSEAFHIYFWNLVNNDKNQAYDMILKNASAMWKDRKKRFLTYAVNQLSLQLEDYAQTPKGKAAKSAGTLTSSMFPFALLDAVTHFGMSEKEYKRSYEANYPAKNPKAYTEYWKQRANVKKLIDAELKANPIKFEPAVKILHKHFQTAATIL